VAARAIGVIASIFGVYAVKAKEGETNALKPINRGFLTASILTIIGTGVVALLYVGNDPHLVDGKMLDSNEGWKVFAAVVVGLLLAQLVSRLTEYFTGTEFSPVQEIAESARTGPATTVLSGTSVGLESSVYSVIAIAIALGVAIALGGGNLQFSLYLVALCGMGMLATTGVVVSEDTFGPVADNAAGIAEMSGEFHGEPERIMVSLDAVGNTTKAVTKGFAIGSAVIAAVALFASFIEGAGKEILGAARVDELLQGPRGVFDVPGLPINVADPKIFIGLLIGGAVPFLFSALAVRAVGRSAGVVVQEVRRQFADGKIMAGTKRPDYGPVIDICTAASLRELATPALLAVLTPAIIGFGIGWKALGAFLASVIVTGQLMAVYLSNSGGAWDNAKKYIEDGHEGGKGSEAHKAAVIGDTVGDPFKDTAGPALNPLIKVMNLISLLILPAVISMEGLDLGGEENKLRFVIAGLATIVLIGAVAFSKRPAEAMDAGTGQAAGAMSAVATAAPSEGVSSGDSPQKLAADALDRWIMDLGDEDADLRKQLREAKDQLVR
jgi:K(+)-stimulated pyrophosphate-energized sodium pump